MCFIDGPVTGLFLSTITIPSHKHDATNNGPTNREARGRGRRDREQGGHTRYVCYIFSFLKSY